MSIRYYPSSKIKPNLLSNGNLVLDNRPYYGKYYETYDGKFFAGANPGLGDNRRLYLFKSGVSAPMTKQKDISGDLTAALVSIKANQRVISNRLQLSPTSYFPRPTEAEYQKGYITRYFVKKVNESINIIEISPEEYADIKNGTVAYDVSFYLTGELVWKIIGPLKTQRLSQYDIRMGIEDMNKAQTEKLNLTFLGIVAYIGGDYSKYARPTK